MQEKALGVFFGLEQLVNLSLILEIEGFLGVGLDEKLFWDIFKAKVWIQIHFWKRMMTYI